MYRFTLLILLFSCLSLQAQYSYTRLEAAKVANSERSIYRLSSKDSICISIDIAFISKFIVHLSQPFYAHIY